MMLIANITVLIVNTDAPITTAIDHALNFQAATRLVVTADYAEAEEQALRLRPDIIWLQMNIGPFDGIANIRRLKKLSPSSRVVVIAGKEDEQEAFAALMAGALGYCSREEIEAEAVSTYTQLLCRDQMVLSPSLREPLMRRFRSTALGRYAEA